MATRRLNWHSTKTIPKVAPSGTNASSLMHRISLQRVDRCSMRHQVEMREPFLDPSVVRYALGLNADALVHDVNGQPRGKAPLRDLYNLYPDLLPSSHP